MAKPQLTETPPARRVVRGCNDNAISGEACVTDTGAPLPHPSITAEELRLLGPLIKALARMAANDLSATTPSSDEA
jgi:hypothetical protein